MYIAVAKNPYFTGLLRNKVSKSESAVGRFRCQQQSLLRTSQHFNRRQILLKMHCRANRRQNPLRTKRRLGIMDMDRLTCLP
jgi:hypothetical protein